MYLLNYDNFADVLYINKLNDGFTQKANRTIIDDDFVAVRKIDDCICGLTIEGFKARMDEGNWNNQLILKYFYDFDIKYLAKYKSQYKY